ncbi:DNA repair protein RecN [Butyricicoccus porcorum]|uniref:DNA repair protein RecN n=1 Tax=Butyricicoccus porcorum TaxID=1945634 RepID=A0A252F2D2_9FIRM|nr:DNA repair protein RecN [Butyricicoccus porcorum]MCI6926639.1 DNA repair protein RecN [Butyricicoccus porcorum]MDD6986839.1 DNA repair protein RecN [Butyricicoccus porcorum]MDY4483181.1 DNA repair protein RecN [Butyricicoccus porcorum]OUM19760.1 DNA repair protein RecN [Butyricicoccus porcorum]
MLSLLHIENIAVIEQADIVLQPGFTVLTGETGAGKSIIIDSIGAIMGQRTSRELIRNGEKKGFVSAVFEQVSPELEKQLQELGLDTGEDGTVRIQRELSAEGRSVCRVNMRPVPASVLKTISPYLINIHGQHDGQKLMQEEYHIDFLDSFCDTEPLLEQYRPLYTRLFSLRSKIRELEKSEQQRAQRIDMLRYQFDEIAAANLKPGEEEELNERRQFFDNAGKLAYALQNASMMLAGDEDTDGACDLLAQTSEELTDISTLSTELNNAAKKAEELRYLAEDLRETVSDLASRVDFSEQERDAVEERLDVIYRLRRKYGATVEEVLAYCDSAASELEELENADDRKEQLVTEYRETLSAAREIAGELSRLRRDAAIELEAKIIEQLEDLDMAKVRLSISVSPQTKLNPRGADEVRFLISTNPGEPVKPLSRIASGGELSRIMLAIKNVLTQSEDVGTLIFDEIDTGVSGRAAQKIAVKLGEISRSKQTLCVTHLPQLAAMGDHHLLIQKSVSDERTYTDVRPLEGEARAQELARMISGDAITELSLRNAEELLTRAAKSKTM